MPSYNNIYALPLRERDREIDREIDTNYLSNYLTRAHAHIDAKGSSVKYDAGYNSTSCKSHGLSDQHDIDEIDRAYATVFGRCMPKSYMIIALDYCHRGMSVDVITDAILRTADARYPAWAYARAIISRSYDEGVRTPADMAARDQRYYDSMHNFIGSRQRDRSSPFMQFDQRNLSDDYYADCFVDLSGGDKSI